MPINPNLSLFLRINKNNCRAVLEWECCIKDSGQGAAEGAPFISDHIIKVTEMAFDDFAGSRADEEFNKRVMGI